MAITYKTVLHNAIQGFNDIQNLINLNSGQLSQTNTSVSSLEGIKGALGHATLSATTSYSSSDGLYNSSNGSVNSSDKITQITSTATNGYYRIKFTGAASTTAGLVKATDSAGATGYVYIKKGSASSSGSISSTTITSDGYYNGSSYNTSKKVALSETQASGYYKITPKASGTTTCSVTEGYIKGSSGNGAISETSTKSYYIKEGSTSVSGGDIEISTVSGLNYDGSNNFYVDTGVGFYFAGLNPDYEDELDLIAAAANAGYVMTLNNILQMAEDYSYGGNGLGVYDGFLCFALNTEIHNINGSITINRTNITKSQSAGYIQTESTTIGATSENLSIEISPDTDGAFAGIVAVPIGATETTFASDYITYTASDSDPGGITIEVNDVAGYRIDGTTSYYTIDSIVVPQDTPFSVSMVADSALDNSSTLTVSNAAYRNMAITNVANGTATLTNSGTLTATNTGTISVTTNTGGTINVNGGKTANGGVSVEGKVVTVDGTGSAAGTAVTNSSGDLITTTRSAGATTITSDYLTTTNTGFTVTASGAVSTGTGWVTSGTTNSTSATKYVKAGEAHNGYVTTAGWITKDTNVYTLSYDSTEECVDFVWNN